MLAYRIAAGIEETPFNPAPVVSGSDPTSLAWGPLVITIVLFFVILIGAAYVIRRMNRGSFRTMSTPWLRVLDRQTLGSGRQVLYLVEIAGQLQVLGITDQQIIKIGEINDPEVAAEILEEIAGRPLDKTSRLMLGLGPKAFAGKGKDGSFPQELKRMLEEVEK